MLLVWVARDFRITSSSGCAPVSCSAGAECFAKMRHRHGQHHCLRCDHTAGGDSHEGGFGDVSGSARAQSSVGSRIDGPPASAAARTYPTSPAGCSMIFACGGDSIALSPRSMASSIRCEGTSCRTRPRRSVRPAPPTGRRHCFLDGSKRCQRARAQMPVTFGSTSRSLRSHTPSGGIRTR